MNIGQVAAMTGLSAKTIRYYESIELIGPPGRTRAGYRSYGESDVRDLVFLKRARRLGFSVRRCKSLLALQRNRHRTSSDVRALAQEQLQEVTHKLRELQAMKQMLAELVIACRGDDKARCPILDCLAQQ